MYGIKIFKKNHSDLHEMVKIFKEFVAFLMYNEFVSLLLRLFAVINAL